MVSMRSIKKVKSIKFESYGKKVKYQYFSVVVEHKKAGKLKIVILKQKRN